MTHLAAPPNGPVPAARPVTGLLNRHAERVALDRLLADARTGQGGSLVLRGAPGIGRTSLLGYAIEQATNMSVARLAGTDAEVNLDFAALHRLLIPFGPRLDRLPEPQRHALSAAFGLITADAPDRFLVGLAAVAVLSGAAVDRPLLVAVDDAHWLDEATTQVLGFVARRLTNEPIALVMAVREPTDRCEPLAGLPELHLAGLPARHAHELLAAAVSGRLNRRVAERIVAEAGGNPLALVEFGRQLSDDQLTTHVPVPAPSPIGGRHQEHLLRWVRTLPAGTRTLLLLAAAEHSGNQAVLRRAADRLGLGANAAGPAEAAGLLACTDEVTFRYPLIRSAVYHGAPPRERRRVHAALAAVVDAREDPDGRAWHVAAAAGGPDEQAAGELAAAAARAHARGDRATEALFRTRAAELTPDGDSRTDRLLDAAAAELSAGAPGRAEALLDRADPALTGQPARARAARLRATVSLARGRFGQAPAALLHAARQLHGVEPEQARRTLLDALYASLVAGCPASIETLLDIVRAARTWPAVAPSQRTTADLLLDGFVARLAVGYPAAAPILRAAVTSLAGDASAADGEPYLLTVGCWAAGELLDGEAQRGLALRLARTVPDEEAGDLEDAGDITAFGPAGVPGRADLVALGWRGREAQARSAVTDQLRTAQQSGAGLAAITAQYALAILELGLGRYDAALTAALSVYREDPPCLGTHVLPDLVEAAVRSGNRSAAAAALERLTERALASGTDLAAGLLSRCRALLATPAEAESRYQEAIVHLQQSNAAAQVARTHLLYGEWLRRQRRRRDAREQLRTARDQFGAAGCEAFEQRARTELLATGERASKRNGEVTDQLTPQEMQVARLVVEGSSNRQVAAQLFISANTVEYHLQKVFRKVGVSSRTQLALRLPRGIEPASVAAADR